MLLGNIYVEERSQQFNFFSREMFHLYRHHQTLLFCTMYYTTMYYILYNIINVKYLKTCSGLQDQRSAGNIYVIYLSIYIMCNTIQFMHSGCLHCSDLKYFVEGRLHHQAYCCTAGISTWTNASRNDEG